MRGLKCVLLEQGGKFLYVASYTDAWIEIIRLSGIPAPYLVASYTDAWIEIVSH